MVSLESSRTFPESSGDLTRKAEVQGSLAGEGTRECSGSAWQMESEHGHENQGPQGTGAWRSPQHNLGTGERGCLTVGWREKVSPPLGPQSFSPHVVQGKS